MIEIDGSYGEGGGQLLRYSIALASLLGKAIKVYNIRAKRSNPGLRPQHMTAVLTIAKLVSADIKGLQLGSKEIVFMPKSRPKGGSYNIDIGTAGSISLFLQATIPVLISSNTPIELTVRGGTSVKWSPPIPYMINVLLPLLSKFGVKAKIELLRRGFYPRGNGLVKVYTSPSYPLTYISARPFDKIKYIKGISYVGNLPRHIAVRQALSAEKIVKEHGYKDYLEEIEIDDRTPSFGKGSGIVLWAETDQGLIGGDSIGEVGKRAEIVGREAAEKLVKELDTRAAIDSHALDNVIIYMSLAKGKSTVFSSELTMHAKTAMDLCSKITGANFSYRKEEDGVYVECEGIEYTSTLPDNLD
ncbi:MAG: RNA 3'-phosphate cyclase [Thermoprotei archaeon]|nr:MAG: RNA 3'-phosphate cyclase [Thermoprotei archaeon]